MATLSAARGRPLKARLAAGERLYGAFLCSASPTLAEILGWAGYDYVVIDMEHGPGNVHAALPCLQALAAARTPAILRIAGNDPVLAKKAMDLGPHGIMVPMVETAADAAKAVASCRYPPRGIRGAAHPVVRASLYGIDSPGYLQMCDEDEVLIMLQIESKAAVARISEIAAVDGVDCLMLGPRDLSSSVGHLDDVGHEEVMALLHDAEDVILSVPGMYLAGFAMPKYRPKELHKRGYHMVSGAADLALFRDAALADVRANKVAPTTEDLKANKFHLYTILVFDSHRNGVPVAWILSSMATLEVISLWLSSFRNGMLDYHKSWEPCAFMVDDAEREIDAIRVVFNIPVFLCLWHVRRCWLKHLVKKVRDWPTRASMFRTLGDIMNMKGPANMVEEDLKQMVRDSIKQFVEDFNTQGPFIDYFKTYWEKKIDMWVRASRNVPHSGQDTNGAIDAYHGVLKYKFLGGSKLMKGRRVDWLLHKLTTNCLPYYWYVQMLKDNGFVRNNAIEKVVLNSYERALTIPDDNVTFHEHEFGAMAFVQSVSCSSVLHTVYNANSKWACCTCPWAEQGNVCKHQLKVLLMKGISHDIMLRQCMELYAGRSLDTHAIAPKIHRNVNENVEGSFEDDAICENFASPSVADAGHRLPNERIVHLESLCADLVALVRDDVTLIDEACVHMKKTMGLMVGLKARSMDAFDANNAFVPVQDGFGNTLKRVKPTIEQKFSRKRARKDQQVAASFAATPKDKRLTMQAKLDEKAKKGK